MPQIWISYEKRINTRRRKRIFVFNKKSLHTVLIMSKKDWERLDELWQKKCGTPEEQEEEIKENRKNFYKFQESLSKKLKNN